MARDNEVSMRRHCITMLTSFGPFSRPTESRLSYPLGSFDDRMNGIRKSSITKRGTQSIRHPEISLIRYTASRHGNERSISYELSQLIKRVTVLLNGRNE